MTKFKDIVSIKRTSCAKCFTLMYSIPCRVDENIVSFLTSFGQPKYPLKVLKLLRIDNNDGYKIESKLGKNSIKFAMPKELENINIDTDAKKQAFENALSAWMSEKLGIEIDMGE